MGKVPYIAFSALQGKRFRASVDKPRTWSRFAEARAAYERGGWDGIGYVLDQGIVLIDLDHCIDSTGELDPRARHIIDLLDSAAERSPTGDGIHIYALGQLPPDAPNRYTYQGLKIEVYGSGRYTTLTGQHLDGTPEDLQPRATAFATFLKECQVIQEENTGGVCGGGAGAGLDHQDQDQARASTMRSPRPRAATATGRAARAGLDDAGAAPRISEDDLTPAERDILARARAARNGADFQLLWQGGDPRDRRKANGTPDVSAADFDLVLILLYWTNDNAAQTARLFRASARYREEKGASKSAGQRLSYLDRTIEKAITRRHYKTRASRQPQKPEPPEPGPGGGPREKKQPAHQDRRITHAQRWTRKAETTEERLQLLQEAARRVADEADAHIREDRRDRILVEAVAPGIGKTHATSEIGLPGRGLKLSWIAERRDMRDQVQALQSYRMIEPCSRHNCQDHLLHDGLARKSRNTMSVHKRHGVPCGYLRQFAGDDSAIFQIAHVRTKHPAKADGIVIDELDLAKWLPEREITISLLTSTLKLYATDSTADRLIRAVEAVITDCSQSGQAIHGRALFEALDQRTGGHLRNWIGELAQDDHNRKTHPWTELEEDDDMAQQWAIEQMAPIVLPHIFVALEREVLKWERGSAWNSYLRVGRGPHGWALYITEPLTFGSDEDDNTPPRVVLDATAPDEEILARVLGERVEIRRAAVDPPPGTRHIAMRTGKRYGLVSLCAQPHNKKNGTPLPNKALLRTAAEIRYLLRELDPTGEIQAAQKVGLVTFKDCKNELGDELGIPEHRRLHFWAARGSNALADCDILFVVGTPVQNPASVERLARAIWADDPHPIDPTVQRDEAGHVIGYVDPRMEKLSRYLTRAELTQCAHRSRALREARTVVTMCKEEIDYLPATETIIDMPQLSPAGLDAWKARRKAERARLDQARRIFEEQGKTVHMIGVRELRAAAQCSTDAAAEYLRQARRRAKAPDQTEQARESEAGTPPHHLCSHTPTDSVPEQGEELSYSHSGTKILEQAAPAASLDPDQAVMAYARAAGYPEVMLPGVHIEAGAGGWGRFMWMQGPTADQWRAITAYVASQQPPQAGPPRLAG